MQAMVAEQVNAAAGFATVAGKLLRVSKPDGLTIRN